jgi:hypothetical protein
MKVEVINRSTKDLVETYSVPDFYMVDFQEWQESSEIVIHLDCLLETVENLVLTDTETEEPIAHPTVDFYLPDPIKNQAISQFAKSQTNPEDPTDEFSDGSDEAIKRLSAPELKSSTILSAVVKEILQNHHPYSDYKVRISDE